MHPKWLVLGLIPVVLLVTLGCCCATFPFSPPWNWGPTFDRDFPNVQVGRDQPIQVGPMQTQNIEVAPPSAGNLDVEIRMGAGTLTVDPGAGDLAVAGELSYNYQELEPLVRTDGNRVVIEQRRVENWRGFTNVRNEWNLRLGSMPMDLTVETGASDSELELGGLALTDLTINHGASDFELAFSDPNQAQMNTFEMTAGASNTRITGLANANTDRFIFRGGAGSYSFDFSGNLQRDMRVTVEGGMGEIVLRVPAEYAAEFNFEGALTNVEADPEWNRTTGRNYTKPGTGPTIYFDVQMGAGNIRLETE